MTGMGYRPYVPADPAKGLRPGTSLPAAPPRRRATRAIRAPEGLRRFATRLRLVTALDVVSVLGVAATAMWAGALGAGRGKFLILGPLGGGAAIAIALSCLSLERAALRLRAYSGWFLALSFGVAALVAADVAPAFALVSCAAAITQGIGSLVVRDVLASAAADAPTTRTAPPPRTSAGPSAAPAVATAKPPVPRAGDPAARRCLTTVPVPAPPGSLVVLRTLVFLGGVSWIVGGPIEATRGNWWLGILATGLGVLAVRRAPDLGRTRTDARVPASDRGNPWAWLVVPLGALGMLTRVAWLLRWI